jgi:hypothetical protein
MAKAITRDSQSRTAFGRLGPLMLLAFHDPVAAVERHSPASRPVGSGRLRGKVPFEIRMH